jgi:hypothetical protein
MIPFKYGCLSQSYSVDSVNHLAVLALISKKEQPQARPPPQKRSLFRVDRGGITANNNSGKTARNNEKQRKIRKRHQPTFGCQDSYLSNCSNLAIFGSTECRPPRHPDGVRFTQPCANSAVCTASRIAIALPHALTGSQPNNIDKSLILSI